MLGADVIVPTPINVAAPVLGAALEVDVRAPPSGASEVAFVVAAPGPPAAVAGPLAPADTFAPSRIKGREQELKELKQKLVATPAWAPAQRKKNIVKWISSRGKTKCIKCEEQFVYKGGLCQQCALQTCSACGRAFLADTIFCSNCGNRRRKLEVSVFEEDVDFIEDSGYQPQQQPTKPPICPGLARAVISNAYRQSLKEPDAASFRYATRITESERWLQAHALLAEMKKHVVEDGCDNLSIYDALTCKLLWSLTVFGDELVAEIQDMLIRKLQRPCVNLDLFHRGRRLEVAKTLGAAGVCHFDSLYAELRPALAVTASRDGVAKVWNIEHGHAVLTLTNRRYLRRHNDASAVTAVAASSDGLCIATGSEDGLAMLWSTEDGMSKKALPRHSGVVLSVAFSADTSFVATASMDCTAKVSSAETGNCLFVLEEHKDTVRSVAFSLEGWILTASDDKTAKIWDRRHGRCTLTVEGHSNVVMATAYSPDCLAIATGSEDKTSRIWNAANGRCSKVLSGHSGAVNSVIYSRDGEMLATGSADRSARLWNVSSGDCLRTICGHAGIIVSVSLSMDSRCIALGSTDCSVSVWEVRSGELVCRLPRAHQDEVTSVMFTCPPGWDAFSRCSKTASAVFSQGLWPT